MAPGWFERLFSSRRDSAGPAIRHEGGAAVADPEPYVELVNPRGKLLGPEPKKVLLDLAGEAAANLGVEGPAVEATWGARTALVFAEAGDGERARALLDHSSSLVREVHDGITATTTLSEISHVQCAVGRALEDGELYRSGLDRVLSVPEPGFRALALARVFDDLTATGNEKLAGEVRRTLMREISALEPFSYSLTVSEVVPILAKSTSAREEVIKLLAEASRRARKGDELLGETTVRDVGILFARTAAQLDDEVLVGRAEELASSMEKPELRAGLLGEIAIAWAELGETAKARATLERQAALVEPIEDNWDRQSAERSVLEAMAVVAETAHDESMRAEVEASIADLDEADRDLTIATVCEAVARCAARTRDGDAIRRAVRWSMGASDGSTRYGEVALLASTLHQCGLDADAVTLLNDAREHSRTLRNPTDCCRAVLGIANAVLQTGIVPER